MRSSQGNNRNFAKNERGLFFLSKRLATLFLRHIIITIIISYNYCSLISRKPFKKILKEGIHQGSQQRHQRVKFIENTLKACCGYKDNTFMKRSLQTS